MLKTQGLTPVTQAQGSNVARQMGAIYLECSSKEMEGVHEVFELAVNTAVGREVKAKEEKERWAVHGGAGSGGGGKKLRKGPCRIL